MPVVVQALQDRALVGHLDVDRIGENNSRLARVHRAPEYGESGQFRRRHAQALQDRGTQRWFRVVDRETDFREAQHAGAMISGPNRRSGLQLKRDPAGLRAQGKDQDEEGGGSSVDRVAGVFRVAGFPRSPIRRSRSGSSFPSRRAAARTSLPGPWLRSSPSCGGSRSSSTTVPARAESSAWRSARARRRTATRWSRPQSDRSP
jgi:hypothetical protein